MHRQPGQRATEGARTVAVPAGPQARGLAGRPAGLLASLLASLLVAPAARTEIRIDVQGVDDTVRSNVLAFLSLERYKTRPQLSTDVLERLHDRVEREVRAALRPFGYYEPKVESRMDKLPNGKDVRVQIHIDPGEPVILKSAEVKVEGPGADDPAFRRIADRPLLRVGERLNHAAYEQVKADLQRTAANFGWFDAKLTRSELRVDPGAHEAGAYLTMQTGPRYHFGATSIEQNVIDDALVRRYVRFRPNEPFDMTELLRTQFAMDDSLYFSTVEVQPGTPDRDALAVPVTIRAVPARRDRYSFGLGYGTDTGARGTVTWDRIPVNRKGHRLSTQLKAAERAQSLLTRYVVPIGDPALDRVSLELNSSREDLADIETRTTALRPSITRVRGRWQWETYVSAQRATTIQGGTRVSDNLLVPGITLASVPKDYLGEALYSRTFYAELRGSHSALGSSSDFLQIRLQSERVFDFADRWHLLMRGDFGASVVSRFSRLPGSFRFFAGGDRSVRGFSYNELSPVQRIESTTGGEPQYIKAGGKHLLTGTVELVRDVRRSFAVAAFVDGGNAFETFKGLEVAASAGVGVRWRLPAVTVGIDVAQAFRVPPDLRAAGLDPGPRLHVNFSPQY